MVDRENITHYNHDPWLETKNLSIFPTLEGSRNDPEQIQQSASSNRIKEIGNNIVIDTDRSGMGATRHGGADPEHPTFIFSEIKMGALYTCSYEEEVEAMKLAITWIAVHRDSKENITICTDSHAQYLYMALASHNPETDAIGVPVRNHITINGYQVTRVSQAMTTRTLKGRKQPISMTNLETPQGEV